MLEAVQELTPYVIIGGFWLYQLLACLAYVFGSKPRFGRR